MMKRHVFNKLLLLKLIELAGEINGATRLQKLVFKAEALGRDQGKLTFNYKFIRWHYGPYSEELKDDLQVLIATGFIERSNNNYKLTQLGLNNIKKANTVFSKLGTDPILSNVLENYSIMNLNKLLREVYSDFSVEENYEKGDTILPIIDGELANAKRVVQSN